MLKGFDRLQRELEEAQRAMDELDGDIGVVNFDAKDPNSIEVAIQSVSQMIDERIGRYASNQFVAPIIEELKEKYREGILQKAAEARLEGEKD